MNVQLLITDTTPQNHELMWRMVLAFPFSMPQEMFGDFWARTWLWWVQSFGCRRKREWQGPTLFWLFFPLLRWRLGAFRLSKCLLRPPLCRPCPLSLPSSTESWGWATQTWQSTGSRRCLTASCLSMFSKKKCSQFITAGGINKLDVGCFRKEKQTLWNPMLHCYLKQFLLEHLALICFFLDKETLSEHFLSDIPVSLPGFIQWEWLHSNKRPMLLCWKIRIGDTFWCVTK